MAKVVKKQGVKKRGKAYKMPDPLPQGEVLEDISKTKWTLGVSIGKGGFGEIYSAKPHAGTSKVKDKYPYVIKIEPHNNGPLFVEMHFYMRNAKKVDVDSFTSSRKLESLGMPLYVASGSHEYKGDKYRFIVMDKFGSDIWKLFLANNRSFPETSAFRIALQILDVLEYIHSKGYIHGDVKGANILLSLANPNQVYLVDFGLAEHYDTSTEFKQNPKKAHNGTIEYLSRDAHLGVPTRRGDLEILGYNLIQWLGCELPWESNLSDAGLVQKSKEKYMSDIPEFLRTCFGNRTPPDAVMEYFKYLLTLKFDTEPNYKKLGKILLSGLKSAGGSLKSALEFTTSKSPTKRKLVDVPPVVAAGKKPKLRKNKATKNSETNEHMEIDGNLELSLEENGHKAEEETNGEVVDGPRKRNAKTLKGTKNNLISKEDMVEETNGEDVDGPFAPRKRNAKRLKGTKNNLISLEDKVERNEEEEDDEIINDVPKKEKVKTGTRQKVLALSKEEIVNEHIETVNETAEMKRIKSKMEAVKVSKVKRPKVKKDIQNTESIESLPSTSGVSIERNRRHLKQVNYSEATPIK